MPKVCADREALFEALRLADAHGDNSLETIKRANIYLEFLTGENAPSTRNKIDAALDAANIT